MLSDDLDRVENLLERLRPKDLYGRWQVAVIAGATAVVGLVVGMFL